MGAAPLFIAGTALSAIGGIQRGFAAAGAAKRAAQISEEQARLEAEAAEFEERQERKEREQAIGATTAAIAGTGVELTGTPLDLLRQERATAEQDIALVRLAGARRAKAFRRQASLERAEARRFRLGTLTGALTTALVAPLTFRGLTRPREVLGRRGGA